MGAGLVMCSGSMWTLPWKSEGGLSSTWYIGGGVGASLLYALAPGALAYHIGLELPQRDWKLQMNGTQLHQP